MRLNENETVKSISKSDFLNFWPRHGWFIHTFFLWLNGLYIYIIIIKHSSLTPCLHVSCQLDKSIDLALTRVKWGRNYTFHLNAVNVFIHLLCIGLWVCCSLRPETILLPQIRISSLHLCSGDAWRLRFFSLDWNGRRYIFVFIPI